MSGREPIGDRGGVHPRGAARSGRHAPMASDRTRAIATAVATLRKARKSRNLCAAFGVIRESRLRSKIIKGTRRGL